MGSRFMEALVTIVLAGFTLAIVSVIVSRKANTTGVIQSFWSGINNNIAVAQSPVTGANVTPVLSYPSSSGYSTGFGS